MLILSILVPSAVGYAGVSVSLRIASILGSRMGSWAGVTDGLFRHVLCQGSDDNILRLERWTTMVLRRLTVRKMYGGQAEFSVKSMVMVLLAG